MLLQVSSLTAGYGGADIIKGISIEVRQGEIVTIAGTNGAGKSTLSKSIVGLVPKVSGSILLNGRDLLKVSPENRSALGLGYVPQVSNVFGSLNVLDNLKVVRNVKDKPRKIQEMIALFPPLGAKLKLPAQTLSGGERQMLAVARALMSDPTLVILDEPTAALSPSLVEQVFRLVARLPEQGVAVLMVEQRARQALSISHRGYILDQGSVVLSGTSEGLLSDSRMAQLYLGRH
ncbi:ABC transporter ATP-binding protein [Paracandidimonas soli]|jgi:ABC-type branched-subunit amino acid transport system ATPase component|uniref:Amino acid/amide ABC transporter ATP-binding protein 2 (HAAT family) n=1 Tax=Paracandidimonas soli TaxID=1917182 RepID=A0A4R3VGR9_9BURK|nr:ABC transporter ATP-binding protein [Paracandidimonas soli]TCV02909.1 amino acid/amide ABC transporter ATP-binding protein 2 (HAAT family) [Paracandidimonas soli]